MKTNKRKVRKYLNCVKEFSRRFDLANRKYLSIFLGFFARIVKVTHFALVINFRERAHRKTHEIARNQMKRKPHEIRRSRDKTEISKEII